VTGAVMETQVPECNFLLCGRQALNWVMYGCQVGTNFPIAE
jgi:hypothetical protein